MRSYFAILLAAIAALPFFVSGCRTVPSNSPMTSSPTTSGGTGQLAIRANGENFVRQGFVTKDGWNVQFEHVYLTLSDVTAYQTDPPFDATAKDELQATSQVSLPDAVTVDLAAGDAAAEPILVGMLPAPAGRYNALSWKVVAAETGPAQGYPLVIQGEATKAGQTIPFTLKLSSSLHFICGDYVGDERKGILAADQQANLEATFHFDHLFGDGEAPPEDEINTGALGFDPLAAIAQGGVLEADTAALQQQLSPDQYKTLTKILPSLGHVGEGHCKETELSA